MTLTEAIDAAVQFIQTHEVRTRVDTKAFEDLALAVWKRAHERGLAYALPRLDEHDRLASSEGQPRSPALAAYVGGMNTPPTDTLGVLAMHADRLTDHRFLANFFRLYLHASALNLLILQRREVSHNLVPAQLGLRSELPAEALADRQRKQFFNRRRDADPLGEGHPCTWPTRLIKVVAEVLVSARRVLVRLSGHWPHLEHLFHVTGRVLALRR